MLIYLILNRCKIKPFLQCPYFCITDNLITKLNTVSDTKLPVSLRCSVHSSTIPWSAEHFYSSRMLKISLSCVSNDKSPGTHVLLIVMIHFTIILYIPPLLQRIMSLVLQLSNSFTTSNCFMQAVITLQCFTNLGHC